MVEFILTESQLNFLKAAVPFGSEEFESLEAGHRLEPDAMSQPRIAINCTAEVASSLLGMAKRFCADVIAPIRDCARGPDAPGITSQFPSIRRC